MGLVVCVTMTIRQLLPHGRKAVRERDNSRDNQQQSDEREVNTLVWRTITTIRTTTTTSKVNGIGEFPTGLEVSHIIYIFKPPVHLKADDT